MEVSPEDMLLYLEYRVGVLISCCTVLPLLVVQSELHSGIPGYLWPCSPGKKTFINKFQLFYL